MGPLLACGRSSRWGFPQQLNGAAGNEREETNVEVHVIANDDKKMSLNRSQNVSDMFGTPQPGLHRLLFGPGSGQR